MKCHYEVLGVARNASDVDIKKAYKKLALRWHPDKNLDNPEEAKEQFQVIQQAWDVLSDPRERAWYDDHREAIIRGAADENYQDNAINLFQYFSTTCFKGYGDDEKGFYTIYRKVFETLAAEDAEFALEEDIDEDVPGFGDSQSSYEDVVHNFYAYWQSYRTKRSYSWLDPYGFQDASNRRVLRIIERENKKVRDKAKRERNEQVRNLVAFVRKRDKRVQAHAAKLAEKAKVNLKKTEERRKQQLLERQRQLKEHTESEWSKFSNMEAELKNIEANLDKEFGQDSLSDSNEEEEEKVETNGLYCVACNKLFKTQKAFANHENSKKHKDNVAAIKSSMIEEDEDFESDTEEDDYDSDSVSVNDGPALVTDSQMPDFLLNPEPNPSSTNYMDAEDSEEELMSDDEGSESQEKPVQKKSLPEGVKLAKGPQMDDALYHSPTTEDEEDITSDEELLSDQEDEVSEADNLIRGKKKRKKIPASAASRVAQSSTSNSACQNISKSSSQSLADDKPGSKRLKKSRVKKLNTAARQKETEENDSDEKSTETSKSNTNNNCESGKKRRDRKTKETKTQKQSDKGTKSKNKNSRVTDVSDLTNRCFTCNKEFSSRNKLFEHLKRAGHCLLINEMNRVRGQEDVGKSQKAQKGVAT